MECTTLVGSGQEPVQDQQGSMMMTQSQLQFQDPVLTILMMPLMHLNQIMMQINKMIIAGPMPGMGMQSTGSMPFTPLQPQNGLKITELRRDSSGNIVSIIEKW